VTREVANKFDVPLRTVQDIWHKGQSGGLQEIKNKLAGVVGRKRIEISPDAIQAIDLAKRTTLQDLANELGMKKSTVYKRFKEGCFRRHTNDIKFTLTDENKMARVKYCLSMLCDTNATAPTFDSMHNVVYIDEKWFYRTRRNQKYYLANNERRPRRAVKSKNFVEKVMFLAVITRPRFDSEGNCIFDGK
jgi:AraC-like DNA-binding protein